jgi:hypothetical protein
LQSIDTISVNPDTDIAKLSGLGSGNPDIAKYYWEKVKSRQIKSALFDF